MSISTRQTTVLTLDANSLYISLTQLFGPAGRFHWSVYITDAQGKATMYNWAEDRQRRDANLPVETYQFGSMDPVTQRSADFRLNLAFIKITTFVYRTDFNYADTFATIFPTGYNNVKDNRDHSISCRTWTLAALQLLREFGLLNLSAEQVVALEATITKIGVEVEERVGVDDATEMVVLDSSLQVRMLLILIPAYVC